MIHLNCNLMVRFANCLMQPPDASIHDCNIDLFHISLLESDSKGNNRVEIFYFKLI